MAQMPRGEPRSVPDPDGEQYDEMIRQEKLKRALAEAGSTMRTMSRREIALGSGGADTYRPESNPIVTIDDRQIDTRCVVGGKAPLSQAELADRRRAIDRAIYMAGSPLAGVGYGLASMLGGSQEGRDRAMLAGGAVDTVMTGAAPLGAQMRGRPSPPRAQSPARLLERSEIRPRGTNSVGQAMGVDATIGPSMLGTGTYSNRKLSPPGWQGHGTRFNEARGHLLPGRLGGTGDEGWNIVTQTQHGSNTPQMSGFEDRIARRVRDGEFVEYRAMPLYTDRALPPSDILLTATGPRAAPAARLVRNPAGRPE